MVKVLISFGLSDSWQINPSRGERSTI